MSAALAQSIHSGSGLQLQRELRRKVAAEDEARQLIAATRGSEVTHAVDAEHALLHATTNEVPLPDGPIAGAPNVRSTRKLAGELEAPNAGPRPFARV